MCRKMNDREWNATINDLTWPRFERLVCLMCEHRLENSVESHKPKAVAFSHRSSLLSEPPNTYRRRQKVINKLDAQGPDIEKDGDDVRSQRSPLLSGDVKYIRRQRKILQERPRPFGCGTRGHIPLPDGIEDYATDSETSDDDESVTESEEPDDDESDDESEDDSDDDSGDDSDDDSEDESVTSSIESVSSASTPPPTSPLSPLIAQLYLPTGQVPPRAHQSDSPTRPISPKPPQLLTQAQQDLLNMQLVMQHLPQNEQPLSQPSRHNPQPGKKRGRADRSSVASMGPRKKNRLGPLETEDDVDWSDVRQFLRNRAEERQPLVSNFGLEWLASRGLR